MTVECKTVECKGMVATEIKCGGRELKTKGSHSYAPTGRKVEENSVAGLLLRNEEDKSIEKVLQKKLADRIWVRVKGSKYEFKHKPGVSLLGFKITIIPLALTIDACWKEIRTLLFGHEKSIDYHGPLVGAYLLGMDKGGRGKLDFDEACEQQRKIYLYVHSDGVKLNVDCKLQHRKGLKNKFVSTIKSS